MGNPWAPPDRSQPPTQPSSGSPTPDPPTPGPVLPSGTPGPRPVPTPDPAGVAAASRTAAWTAATLLGSVLLLSAPWPGLLLAPLAALGALALGIVAVVRAVRAHGRGPDLALPAVLVVVSVVWVGISAQALLFVDAARDFSSCTAAALTQEARQDCVTQLEQDRRERTESLVGRLPTPRPT